MQPTDTNDNKKKAHANRMPKRQYAYFRDDQITFLVTHPTDAISVDELENFRNAINAQLAELGGGTIVDLPQTFTFPIIREDTGGIDIYLAKLNNNPSSPQDESNSALEEAAVAPRAFSMLFCNLVGGPDEPVDLLDLIRALRQNAIDQPPIGTLSVADISPNWLMSVSSQSGGTGGPGGLPTAFRGTPEQAPYEFTQLIEALSKVNLYGDGQNVDVAILDTAPDGHELVLAAKEWPDHPLIPSLLGPTGKLTLYPASYQEVLRMGNPSLNRHDYKMSDHGLFAAGIIHSIVPEAKIHLIEVLNQFGIGDLASLAAGMQKVYTEIYKSGSGRYLVVNCSWMLELPLSDDHCAAIDEKDPEYDFEQAVLQFVKDEEEQQALQLRALCESISMAGGKVIAAAGNDWEWAQKRKRLRKNSQADEAQDADDDNDDDDDDDDDSRPQEPRENAPEARYPAAFESVVGVGALPKNPKRGRATGKYTASSYSNLGDKPTGDAIMTLGGEKGKKKGVLGLYVGEKFPVEIKGQGGRGNYRRQFRMVGRKAAEKNCWAWWAGTSFATPIVTATIAAVLSSPNSPGRAENAVRALYDAQLDGVPTPVVEQDGTDMHEDVMIVVQGK